MIRNSIILGAAILLSAQNALASQDNYTEPETITVTTRDFQHIEGTYDNPSDRCGVLSATPVYKGDGKADVIITLECPQPDYAHIGVEYALMRNNIITMGISSGPYLRSTDGLNSAKTKTKGFSVTLEDIGDGDYCLQMERYYSNSLTSIYFTVDSKTQTGTQRGNHIISPIVDPAKEWVLFNPGDATHGPRTLRLRIDTSLQTKPQCFPVVMTDDSTPEAAPLHIASLHSIVEEGYGEGLVCVHSSGLDVPSILWGIGLDKEYISAESIDSALGLDNTRPWGVCPDEIIYDFANLILYKQAYGSIFDPFQRDVKVYREYNPALIKLENGELRQSLTMAFSTDGGESISSQSEIIEGIGPVGRDVCSNLPFPAFNVPEGIIPTHLAYVRSLIDGSIIYTADAEMASVARTRAEDCGIVWEHSGGRVNALADGKVTLTLILTDGTVIARTDGIGGASLRLPDAITGPVIARASCASGESVRKLAIR